MEKLTEAKTVEGNGSAWGIEEGQGSLASFPPGDTVLVPTPFREPLFADVDNLLAEGECPEGRFEVEAGDTRLTCLIHQSEPYLAGLQERDVYSQVPLSEFPGRVRQLTGASCSLVRTDNASVLMAGVHFCMRPYLQGSTRLVNPAHVLRVLASQKQDAALALERQGGRTLLFLNKGQPARLFFGDPRDDPGEGDLSDRLLLYAFADSAPPGKVEVFTSLKLPADPDRGKSLADLAAATLPPPVVMIHVRIGEREVRQRIFLPPAMIVGRDPTCNLFIDNLAISRRHARLSWERGHFVIEDLGSSNGTSVNGELVKRAVVTLSDRVEIGKFEITMVELPNVPSAPETVFLKPQEAAALLKDEVVCSLEVEGETDALALTGELLIGRGEGVDVRARGLFVSPVHARIIAEGEGVYRLHCFGRKKVKVNGVKVTTAVLEPGDRIVVGRSAMQVVVR